MKWLIRKYVESNKLEQRHSFICILKHSMFIPYNERPEWADVVPIPQDDGPDPLAPISYPAEYQNAMDYFRAISRNDEISERALKLTEHIIDLNPAHYTIWHYRQKILFALNSDLYEELNFIEELAVDRSKNYQLWHHRQLIVERLGDISRELDFISSILEDDSKNYHAWSYRQWVVARFDLWDKELTYLDDMIIDDVRNNSAWNHRFFILFEGPVKPTDEVIESEIEYTKGKIRLAPNNQSPWNYIKGLLAKKQRSIIELETFCNELQSRNVISPHLMSTLVDIYQGHARSGKTEYWKRADELCEQLAESHDTIRKKYWLYRKHNKLVA